MAEYLPPAVVDLQANISDFLSKMDRVIAKVKDFGHQSASAEVGLDGTLAIQKQLAALNDQLAKWGFTSKSAQVALDGGELVALDLTKLHGELQKFAETHAVATVSLDGIPLDLVELEALKFKIKQIADSGASIPIALTPFLSALGKSGSGVDSGGFSAAMTRMVEQATVQTGGSGGESSSGGGAGGGLLGRLLGGAAGGAAGWFLGGSNGGIFSTGKTGGFLGMAALSPFAITGIVAAVLPLLGILPPLIGLMGGVAMAFTAAGAAAFAFGGIAYMAITAALKGGPNMDPWLKTLRAQLLNAGTVFGNFFDKATKMEMPTVSKIVGQWITVGVKILPDFLPLIKAGGVGMEAFTRNLTPAFTNPAFKQFVGQLAKTAPGVMGAAGSGLANVGVGMANIGQAFLPMVPLVDKGFVQMTESFKNWAMSLQKSKGFKSFIADAKKSLPDLAKLFGYVAGAVFWLIGTILMLSAKTGPAFMAIVKGLGDVIRWVEHVVKSIVGWYGHMTGLNEFVSRALSSIATGFGKFVGWVSQLIAGLGRWLHTHWSQIVDDAEIAWNIVSTAVKIAWEVITTIIHLALLVIVPILSAAWTVIFHVTTFLWTLISTAIRDAVLIIIRVVQTIGTIIGFLVGVWDTVTTGIHNFLKPIFGFFNAIFGPKGSLGTVMATVVGVLVSPFITAFNQIVSWYNDTLGHIFGDMHTISVAVRYPGQGSGAPQPSGVAGHAGIRALGGPVFGGSPYLVGEMGPELFVPRSSGAIVPNNRLGGSSVTVGSPHITIKGTGLGQAQLAAAIDSALSAWSANMLRQVAGA